MNKNLFLLPQIQLEVVLHSKWCKKSGFIILLEVL